MTDDKNKDQNDQDYVFPKLHDEDQPAPEAPAEVPAASEPPADDKPPKPKIDKLKWLEQHKTPAVLVGFAVIVLLMWGVHKLRQTSSEDGLNQSSAVDEIPVNVIEAQFGRFQDEINATGTLKGEVEIELRFEVDGTIRNFPIQEGGRVERGQIIANLNDRDAKLKVDQAKNDLSKYERLYRIGGTSKTKLDEARLNLEVAQSELDKTRIVAPRSGIIGDKAADIGEFVTPQRKIATLVSIKSVVVEVGIIEKQVDKVYPGQKILVTVDTYPGNVFDGIIDSIDPIVEGGARTNKIRAKIPNPDNLLLPGMFARTRIITFESDDAISIPNDALEKTAGGFQVYVVTQENTAQTRDVDVGHVATEKTQILSGLEPGEIVIVQRPQELKAGSKIKIIEVQKQGL